MAFLLSPATLLYAADHKALGLADLHSLRWQQRVVLLFSKTDEASVRRQQAIFAADPKGMHDRDLVVYTFAAAENQNSDIWQRYAGPANFTFVLIGKDGTQKWHADQPVLLSQLFMLIDAMPMRQQEMRSLQ